MKLLLDIAIAHLAKRRRQSIVSVLGVALGVGFFVAIAAMMQGFQKDFVNRVINVQPHVLVRDEYRAPLPQPAELAHPDGAVRIEGVTPREEWRGIRNWRAILDATADEAGLASAPYLSGQALLSFGSRDVAVTIIGILPDRERKVSNLEADLVAGRLDDLQAVANGIILGKGVADKVGAVIGDTLTVVSPAGISIRMRVVGIVDTGITAVDNVETYTLLKRAQVLQDRANVINRIRLRLTDFENAPEVAARLERRFGYRAESWQEASNNVLGIFVIQNGIMYSTTGAILVVACFGIFNIVSTVVFEKTRDIGILKSIGFRERDILRLFVAQGLAIGIVGSLLGCGLGFALTELLASIRFDIEGFVRTQGFILDRSFRSYAIAGTFAILSSTLAAWLPARRAAMLKPVDIVRGAA